MGQNILLHCEVLYTNCWQVPTQISRAICQAAYKKPLAIEEISISTGIPTMDLCKIGNKYATNWRSD